MTSRRSESRARLLISTIAGISSFAAFIFMPAGRIDWPRGWSCLGIITISLLAGFIYLRRVNPEVIEHRLHLGKGTKLWDIIWSARKK
jgi:hypothetical protein